MCSIDNIEHARFCLSCEPCDVIACFFIESLAILVSCERWGVIRYIIAKGETDQKNNHQNKQTNMHTFIAVWNINMKMLSYSGNALAMIVRAICGYQHENAHIAAMRSPTMAKLASRNWHGRLVSYNGEVG